MNREILFRAWDSKFGVMIPHVCPYDNNNLLIVDTLINECYPEDKLDDRLDSLEYGGEEHYCMMKDFVLMQFTGLKDKNGTPIYEGDIVKCGKSKDAMTALIVFKQQSFLLLYLPKEEKDQDNVYDHMEDYKYFTVLGNEFDSPELLNKQQ